MKPGDVSPLREMEDKTWLIMRCEKHIPADATVTYQSNAWTRARTRGSDPREKRRGYFQAAPRQAARTCI